MSHLKYVSRHIETHTTTQVDTDVVLESPHPTNPETYSLGFYGVF